MLLGSHPSLPALEEDLRHSRQLLGGILLGRGLLGCRLHLGLGSLGSKLLSPSLGNLSLGLGLGLGGLGLEGSPCCCRLGWGNLLGLDNLLAQGLVCGLLLPYAQPLGLDLGRGRSLPPETHRT